MKRQIKRLQLRMETVRDLRRIIVAGTVSGTWRCPSAMVCPSNNCPTPACQSNQLVEGSCWGCD